jgi:uncharacterized membrane-anchored protein
MKAAPPCNESESIARNGLATAFFNPARMVAAAELHSRPFPVAAFPTRVINLVWQCTSEGQMSLEFSHDRLNALCNHFNVTGPARTAVFFQANFPGFVLLWERHREFVSYTFLREGPFDYVHPFESGTEILPPHWLGQFFERDSQQPGQLLVAMQMALEPIRDDRTTEWSEVCYYLIFGTILRSHRLYHFQVERVFDNAYVLGSDVAAGSASVFTDYRVAASGYSRVLIRQKAPMDRQRVGRMIKRLIDAEVYRVLALQALPVARRLSPTLTALSQRLQTTMQRLSDSSTTHDERAILEELSMMSTQLEDLSVGAAYRLSAAQAYAALVQEKFMFLKLTAPLDAPAVRHGDQSFSGFVSRRLNPSMRFCESVSKQTSDLCVTLQRATRLLQTRINVRQQETNAALLRSMNERAELQVRIQETVEGLSVVCISYYATGLVGYLFKGIHGLHALPLYPDTMTGLAAPLVVLAVWRSLQWTKRKIHDSVHTASK